MKTLANQALELSGVWTAELSPTLTDSAPLSEVGYTFQVDAAKEFDGLFYLGIGGRERPATFTENGGVIAVQSSLGDLKNFPVYIRVTDGSPLWMLKTVEVSAQVGSETYPYDRSGDNWIGGSYGSIIYLKCRFTQFRHLIAYSWR